MTTFKVSIPNLHISHREINESRVDLQDQEGGMKFFKKMGSDFKKSRAQSKKRSTIRKQFKIHLNDLKNSFYETSLAKSIAKLDKKLSAPIFKEFNDSIKSGVMGVGAGFLAKAIENIPNNTLDELDDTSDAELEATVNTAIIAAIRKAYPGSDTFPEFAEASVNNSIRKVYKGFKDEADEASHMYFPIPENTKPTIEQVTDIFLQMRNDRTCYKIGLKNGESACNLNTIEKHNENMELFKKDVKEIETMTEKSVSKLNELINKYENFIAEIQNLGYPGITAATPNISKELELKKPEALVKVYKTIFNIESDLSVPEDIKDEKSIYKALQEKYFDKTKHIDGIFTPDALKPPSKSPL